MMLWRVRIRPLDLDKALGTYWLIAASSLVEIRRVVEEADRTLGSILVEIGLDRLPIDVRIVGKLYLLRGQL